MSSANKSHICPLGQDSSCQAVCGGEAKSWSLYLDTPVSLQCSGPQNNPLSGSGIVC